MVTDVLLLNVIEIREYIDAGGNSPFEKWFNRLNGPAAAKATIALARVDKVIWQIAKA